MEKIKEFYKNNKFIVLLFSISFILRFIAILILKTPIESDFAVMYNAALELINGTHNYRSTDYFLLWGYQMGHVIYETILLSIFNSATFLKIINCLITSLTVVFIYLISKKIFNEKSAKIASIIYTLFPFPLLLNSVLTNQFLPILLTLIAIYILIDMDYNKFIKKSIIIGLLLGLGNIFRSEGIVFVFSIFLYSIFLIIKKLPVKKIISSFLLIFISYISIFQIASYTLKVTNLSTNGLNNMNTYWKFVVGFNHDTKGRYSNEDAKLYSHDADKAKEISIERMKEYKKLPKLFYKKSTFLWLGSDLNWSLNYPINDNIKKILNITNKIFIYSISLLCIGSIFSLLKKWDNKQMLITIILAVYFGVYLLIEVMPRYAYSLQVFEIILATSSINYIINKKSSK